jgi:3-hydroxybutyrate dehydrogenase
MAGGLEGRAALVTGAASGIGRAIAERFAAEGAEVAVVDVDGEGAERVAASLSRGYAIRCDVGEPAACRAAVAEVERRSGRIDVLVNNAGVQHVAALADFPDEQWDRLLAVILSGAFHMIKAAFPSMTARKFGRILNVTSMYGVVGAAYKVAYTASKHGLHGLTKTVALEGAEHGVTCYALAPAFVRTPLVERQVAAQAAAHGISEEEVVERVMVQRPLVKRLLEPEEVADAALFLVGPQTTFLTGGELRLDGGWSAW